MDASRIGIVYTVDDRHQRQVMLLWSNDSGNSWSKTRPLSAPNAKASHPRLIALPEGYRAFWSEQRENGAATWMTVFLLVAAAAVAAGPSI